VKNKKLKDIRNKRIQKMNTTSSDIRKRNLPEDWKGALVTTDLAALKPSDLDPDGDALEADWTQGHIGVTLTVARSHDQFSTWITAERWDGRNWDCVANDSEIAGEIEDPVQGLLESLDGLVTDEDGMLDCATSRDDAGEVPVLVEDYRCIVAACREAAAYLRRATGRSPDR
jgi:hypothetical protein